MKIRTFSDSGLLLFANHQSQRDFFALHMKDGKPLFQFDNGKGRAEVVGVKSINDGKWHKVFMEIFVKHQLNYLRPCFNKFITKRVCILFYFILIYSSVSYCMGVLVLLS